MQNYRSPYCPLSRSEAKRFLMAIVFLLYFQHMASQASLPVEGDCQRRVSNCSNYTSKGQLLTRPLAVNRKCLTNFPFATGSLTWTCLWPIDGFSRASSGSPVSHTRRLKFTLSTSNDKLKWLSIHFWIFTRVSGSHCPELGVLCLTPSSGEFFLGLQYGPCPKLHSKRRSSLVKEWISVGLSSLTSIGGWRGDVFWRESRPHNGASLVSPAVLLFWDSDSDFFAETNLWSQSKAA